MTGLLQDIRDFIYGLFDLIVCAIKSAFCWMLGLLFDGAFAIAEWFIGLLPASAGNDFVAPLLQTVMYIELWVPISFGLGLVGAWALFIGTFIAFKFILKLIPFVG